MSPELVQPPPEAPSKSTVSITSSALDDTSEFRVVFIGAGGINFGSIEGPWDHSSRLERKLGPRLSVKAIIDPSLPTSGKVLARKKESFVSSAYAHTRLCDSLDSFVSTMGADERPHAFIVGSPPAFRGSVQPGKNMELCILKAFPTDTPALFIEKPLSTGTVVDTISVARTLVDSKTVVAVGYFLRYLQVVQKMRSILEDNKLRVMATTARYVCCYANIANAAWWTKSKYCGPVVEQATHFIDLSRYFGGDVELDSVSAHALEWYEEAGELSAILVDEQSIAEEDRIPRVTSSTWKYKSGAVGHLTHALTLKSHKYSTELEVYADGYSLRLVDPYNAPQLRVRHPEGDEELVYIFDQDDPYFNQMTAFVDRADSARRGGNNGIEGAAEILSSYEDAAKTYALSWAIREASERSRKTARRAGI